MILKISLRAKGGVPKTLLEQKHRLNFLYFPQNTLMLTESREEFSDLHSIFRLRALRYCCLYYLLINSVDFGTRSSVDLIHDLEFQVVFYRYLSSVPHVKKPPVAQSVCFDGLH